MSNGSKFKYKKSQVVQEQYGCAGTIREQFSNWHSLPGDDFLSMTKAQWLSYQERPYTEDELDEPWYSVDLFAGGSCYSCESRLINISN